MIFKWFRLVTLLIITGMIYLTCQVGLPFLETPLPALGKLANPFSGFFKNGKDYNSTPESLSLKQLQQPVEVLWNERKVPHIFAKNDHDLYFTQGYLTAKDRLWQMDFVSRVSEGRIAEVVGPKAVNFDQFHRRIGLPYAAKKAIDTLKNYPEEYAVLQAYADGVNAYIAELKAKNYPVEFKILSYKPEKWSPYKSALIQKYMAWDLDGNTYDKYISNAKEALPKEVFEQGFPLQRPYAKEETATTPIQQLKPRYKAQQQPNKPYGGHFSPKQYQKGSNNWVVSGKKTRSGNPILANDPHLTLSLPSLWYENQLSSPTSNVYGVSLPGVPMVIIGFNSDIAWGLTYTTSDRIDFVKLKTNTENQYQLNGKWQNALILKDTIYVRGANKIENTTLFTDFGPIIYTDSIPNEWFTHIVPDINTAMNWTAHQPSLEVVSLHKLNRAKNVKDYKEALSYFSAPGQNFAFASNQNNIAIWHTGKFPIREANQARFVSQTATDSSLWQKFIPFDQLPHHINPSNNYLLSANEQPNNTTSYYLGSDEYSDFERSARIAEVLDSLNNIVPSDFMSLQLDKRSMIGAKLLPYLLQRLPNNKLTAEERDIKSELQSWDFEFSTIAKAPGFYYRWMNELEKAIWKDEAKPEYKNTPWMLPQLDVTTKLLLTDSLSTLYDNKNTAQIESQKDIILSSFKTATKSFTAQYGSLNEKWQWSSLNPTTINSLADIEGFGYRRPLPTGGSADAVNAISGNHGPSWRMIVELDKNGKHNAYGVYPGGQSGNPGSPNYDDFVDTWAKGNYYKLQLLDHTKPIEISVTKTQLNP